MFFNVGIFFYVHQFRVTANRSGGRAGSVKQNGVKFFAAEVFQIFEAVGADNVCFKAQAPEVFAQGLQPFFGDVKRRDFGTGVEQLRCFAAGSRAQVENSAAIDVGQCLSGQRSGKVLYPP